MLQPRNRKRLSQRQLSCVPSASSSQTRPACVTPTPAQARRGESAQRLPLPTRSRRWSSFSNTPGSRAAPEGPTPSSPRCALRPGTEEKQLARSEASEESARGSLSPRSPLLGPERHLPPLQTGSRYGRDRVVVASSLALASLCLSFLLRELVPGQLVPTSGELYTRPDNTEKLQGSLKAVFAQSSHQQGAGTGLSVVWAVVKQRLRAAMERGAGVSRTPLPAERLTASPRLRGVVRGGVIMVQIQTTRRQGVRAPVLQPRRHRSLPTCCALSRVCRCPLSLPS